MEKQVIPTGVVGERRDPITEERIPKESREQT